MILREGTRDDWNFVNELGRRTLRSSATREASDAGLETSFTRLIDFALSQSYVLLVAEEAQRRIGFLILLDALPDEVSLEPQGFIAYMAVEPDAIRRGVGTALIEAAENEARRRGLPYISLMVTESNLPAMRLYERAGYETERRLLCKRL